MSDPAGAAGGEALSAVLLPRDVVVGTGPEAERYLQGQLSQDVTAAGSDGSAWSWLLAPNGKVDALLRVTRVAAEAWLIDTDAGWGAAVVERLNRFKLRTRADFALSDLKVVGLRGPGWQQVSVPQSGKLAAPPWPGVEGADLIGTGELPPGVATVDPADYEAARIRAGIPRMGAELDERTIPAETGLVALTVSFTKGCYTGQELVARIDSRGSHVARHLRGLRFEGRGGPAVGATLLGPDGQTTAGTVTSAAWSAAGGWVGLGYVRRGVGLAEPLSLGGLDGAVRQVELKL